MGEPPKPGKYPKSERHGAEGAVWRKLVKAIIARDHGLCEICLHPGADSADHRVPISEDPSRSLDPTNLAATHSKPCAICTEAALRNGWEKPIRCNYIKGANAGGLERARRLIEERTGLKIGEQKEEAKPQSDGRPWLCPVIIVLMRNQFSTSSGNSLSSGKSTTSAVHSAGCLWFLRRTQLFSVFLLRSFATGRNEDRDSAATRRHRATN
jgi:hypothetical protein